MAERTSAKKEALVCELYRGGMSMKAIASQVGLAYGTVHKILHRNGVPVKWAKIRHLEAEISTRYLAGENLTQLADAYGVKVSTLHKRLVNYGTPIRSSVEYLRERYPLREDAFATPSPESNYWVGLLMADGCIHSRNYLSLALSFADLDHIEKFKTFIGAARHSIDVQPGKGFANAKPLARLCVGCPRMVSDLAKYGLTPRKSHTAEVIGLESDRDFWRGAVDGDGWIGSTSPTIGLTGSLAMVKQFMTFAYSVSPICQANIRANHSIWSFCTYGTHAYALMQAMYGNCCVALERKQQLADYWLARKPEATINYAELARQHGMTRQKLHRRLQRGWSLEDALLD